jgi:F-type H+-transporting ATPase subunit b
LETLQNILPLAAEEEGGGSFLVSPGLGLMIWTLIAFLISFYILKRAAYPRIQEALEKRANAVAESIDAAKRTREEADQLLQEYRERLREAREQADDIVHRARQSSERFAEESKTEAKHQREEMMEQTRAGDAACARRDPARGGRFDDRGHREGDAQVARRGGPEAARRGGPQ